MLQTRKYQRFINVQKKYDAIVVAHCQFKAYSQDGIIKFSRKALMVMGVNGVVEPKPSWGF